MPEVSTIIDMKARATSNMRLREVDKDGNDRETPAGQMLINLIKKPNWFQSGNEFIIQTKTFREIFGNEYIFKTTPTGFKPTLERVKSLFPIPDSIVKVIYDNKVPYFLNVTAPKITYKVKRDHEWDEYDQSLIIHFNDNRVSIESSTDKNLLKGESRMRSHGAVINILKAAYESKQMILKHRGANGAWVTKSKDMAGAIPLDKKDKEDLQKEMAGYGTLDGQHQDIITNAELAWIQRGVLNPSHLGIPEEVRDAFDKLLDAYGVPAEIFVRAKGSTYENQNEAEKALYVRTVIPEANEWIAGLSGEFELKDTYIIPDYLHLPCFQEDLKERGESLSAIMGALSVGLQDGAVSIEQYKKELEKFGIK